MNCDVVQGFYIAHPKPATDFSDWAAGRCPTPAAPSAAGASSNPGAPPAVS